MRGKTVKYILYKHGNQQKATDQINSRLNKQQKTTDFQKQQISKTSDFKNSRFQKTDFKNNIKKTTDYKEIIFWNILAINKKQHIK